MTQFPQEELRTDQVVLRRPSGSDVDDLVTAAADPAFVRFLPHLPHPYTQRDAHWWLEEGVPATWRSGGTAFTIADPASGRLLGGTGVGRVFGGVGEIGYWVAPWARRRGVATTAVRLHAAWIFRHGLARLELMTDPENVPSQRVALAAGFQREGVRRSGGFGAGDHRYDQVSYARLATDPGGPTPRLLPDLPGGELSDATVTLRPLDAGDVADSYRLRQLHDVVTTSVSPYPPSRDQIVRRCALGPSMWLSGAAAALTIRDSGTDSYLGEIALYYQDPLVRQGTIGYDLTPAARGRGYAARAVRLLAGWAFGTAGLTRLTAWTRTDNTASQRVLVRCGFVRVGIDRGRLPGADGQLIDTVTFDLLPEDLVPS